MTTIEPTVVDLDDRAVYERLDPTGMRGYIERLPAQCREAWDAGQRWALPPDLRRPGRVLVLGMGGSAIGAEVVTTVAARTSTVPMQVVRGYNAPPTDEHTLVVASSWSGETEETLESFQRTLGKPGMRLAITSGGRLGRLGAELGYNVFPYEFAGQPRAAIGWGVFSLLAILQRLGAIPITTSTVEAACAELDRCATDWGIDVPIEQNAAKQIAQRLYGRVPVVLGADVLEVAARRWAGQLAENAKQWALFGALPEANHNLIVGFNGPPVAQQALYVLQLDSATVHERTRLHIGLTAGELDETGILHDELLIGGEEPLDSIMRACYLGDWVSLYLAMLNGVDPTATAALVRLKTALTSHQRSG
jgi:glucose/mannose-6-phosphate isomerase